MSKNAQRFRHFIAEMTRLVEKSGNDEKTMHETGGRLLTELISHDDWLPDEAAQPHPQFYQQYLLYCDPLERFSVVSFVWGPGQKTPVHDHTVWGLVGMMRGAELARRFSHTAPGQPMVASESERLLPGQVDRVSPTVGDIHEVSNALADKPSISIHVYGANIGAVKRHVFDPATGADKPFVSGYSSPLMPNFWDRSAEVRASITPAA
ncbi:MAG: cysteine dioxygenase [Burkholderiales bacterium]|nr:cysteine dioxygenase [Burkholderiales bacterium]